LYIIILFVYLNYKSKQDEHKDQTPSNQDRVD
jgi:hypothetical protein